METEINYAFVVIFTNGKKKVYNEKYRTYKFVTSKDGSRIEMVDIIDTVQDVVKEHINYSTISCICDHVVRRDIKKYKNDDNNIDSEPVHSSILDDIRAEMIADAELEDSE